MWLWPPQDSLQDRTFQNCAAVIRPPTQDGDAAEELQGTILSYLGALPDSHGLVTTNVWSAHKGSAELGKIMVLGVSSDEEESEGL